MMKPFAFLIGATLGLLPACGQNGPRLVTTEDETTIYLGSQAVLTYVHSETLPPEGVDPVYRRSAYIHPLYSPGGERLTRIQPPDHWHHYGIWNPWTRTHFGEYKVDFWNLAEGQGTVRFAEYLEKMEGKEEAGFRVRQEHIYFKEDGSDAVALDEVWKVTVRDLPGQSYQVDLYTTLSTPLGKMGSWQCHGTHLRGQDLGRCRRHPRALGDRGRGILGGGGPFGHPLSEPPR